MMTAFEIKSASVILDKLHTEGAGFFCWLGGFIISNILSFKDTFRFIEV
jgi:hypothetical protein